MTRCGLLDFALKRDSGSVFRGRHGDRSSRRRSRPAGQSRRGIARYDGDLGALKTIAAKAPTSARRPLAGLDYDLPVMRPGKIVCLGLNYLEHVKEGRYADNPPRHPTLFMRGRNSIVAHLEPLVRPRVSETFDYEAELVAVIGRPARHMTLDNALSCVAGMDLRQ